MKKLLTMILAGALVLGAAGCSSSASSTSETATTSDESETTEEVKDSYKVAVLVPKVGDQSYFDTLARGVDSANEEYENVEVRLIEVGDTTDAATWAAAFDEVCEDGEYDFVLSGNSSYESNLWTACEKYPDQMFVNFDYSALPESGIPANCYVVDYALDDLGYVVGALSAALTQSGTVGVVVGMDNSGMNQFISGYCQVLAANDVKYVISYPGTFSDTAAGYEAGKQIIGKGADVIWQVAGGTGTGVIQACSEVEGVWAIGVDQDQHEQFAESNPDYANTIITSALKNSDVVLLDCVNMLVNGTLADKMGTQHTYGITEDGVGIAENDFYLENVSEEIRNKVAETLEAVKNGEVEVADTKTMADYDTEWPALRDANIVD